MNQKVNSQVGGTYVHFTYLVIKSIPGHGRVVKDEDLLGRSGKQRGTDFFS